MGDTTTLGEATRSPVDGSESIRLATTGANWKATINQIFAGAYRTKATGDITINVSTTGNDSTGDGSVGNPYLTWNKAYAVATQTYDFNGHALTLQGNNATHTNALSMQNSLTNCSGITVDLNGGTWNSGAPEGNINTNASFAHTCKVTVSNMVHANGSGIGISINAADFQFGAGMNFGACGSSHIEFDYPYGTLLINNNYTISGGALRHFFTFCPCLIAFQGTLTVTVSGSPAFGGAFADIRYISIVNNSNVTFSGAATGTRYNVDTNSIVNSNGAGVNWFPGSVAGGTSSQGQYL